ncbi:uncharacterized protein ACA1_073060 [Acanthamoeba castellanii str. Neff]|uniref:GINS subunit domain-containing protein n=1 Tax=Acanthamoeba castellanii (strain ATCC 30010 / Neff) TaxID=1257118 RepID=L8HEL4_ACACF|nr:uncharacterized protein ACA1_073060 [Acanthamoeba castellanii str. Neff]ELR23672.1 hypothetical protein ACA1_073060 [Acanthamoeba castellanii str. Neff]
MEASVADAGSKSFGGDGDDGLLRMAVMNELIAPEVLPFQTELISKTKDFVDAEEEKSNQSYKGESEDAFLRRQLLTSWYLQRVKYALSAYLQTRLRKIQKHAEYILHSPLETHKLSDNELQFLKQFRELELEQSRALDLISPKIAERIGNSGTPKAGTLHFTSLALLLLGVVES